MRIAILDLGTNTFHLLIVSVSKVGVWKKLFKSKVVVKLGEGAIHKHEIAPIPFKRGINAIVHYKKIIDTHRPDKVFAFATSAIRGANNQGEFLKEAKSKTGISINVITGDQEAELIYLGVRQCVKIGDEKVLIMDIGGGSTEFIIADAEKIFWKHSFDIGAARMLELFKPSDPILPNELKQVESFLKKELQTMFEAMAKFSPTQLIGSSGSFDTFAEIIGYKFYGKNVIKNLNTYTFNSSDYKKLHETLLYSTVLQRKKTKGLIKMRVDMIVLASICTNFVLNKTGIKTMALSKYALKEGALEQVINEKR